MVVYFLLFFFFFQAEDGIRDADVTGVQTCALPISNGISRERGLTTPDPAVAEVKAQVIRVARRRVFCGVHTKFGVSSFCRFADIGDFETIITDTSLPATEAHR